MHRGKKLEVFNKELKNIKNQTDMRNTITEMKNILEGINSCLNETEEQISKLEDTVVEIIDAEQKKDEKK